MRIMARLLVLAALLCVATIAVAQVIPNTPGFQIADVSSYELYKVSGLDTFRTSRTYLSRSSINSCTSFFFSPVVFWRQCSVPYEYSSAEWHTGVRG